MPEQPPKLGVAAWIDLTVENADELRDFYAAAVGWQPTSVPMGDYSDYSMTPPGAESATAGICHLRGANQGIPPMWIVYFTVRDLDASLREVAARGGVVVNGPRDFGTSRYALIRDPAGACCALYQP